MILWGSLVNGGAIMAGTLVGILAGKLLNERIKDTLIAVMALITIGIAIPGLIDSQNALVPIVSLVSGSVLGEVLNIDGKVTALGDSLQHRFQNHGSVTEGFVTGSLVFAVGAMAIMGALDSGLRNNHSVLYAKSLIDAVYSVVFASTMGIGVAFSGLTVFLVEGLLAVLASLVAPLLSSYVIAEITYVGSLLIIAISLNMLGVTKLRILNMAPAVLFPILLCQFMK
ncbi:MAG: DUF554 domain-containing protein [Clostridiales bacterium]|nr:DUF554 domain-containing protein [Candidatus Cacconaster stercorequi]